MTDSAITLIVLAVTVGVFIIDRLPVAVVALFVALSLWAFGVLDLSDAVAGFGDPTVLFIAALFVVSEALDATGVTTCVGNLARGLTSCVVGRRFRVPRAPAFRHRG